MEIENKNNNQKTILNVEDKPQKGVNVPNLRFKDENWEKVKLGEICSKFDYGIGAEAVEFDGKNKYIRITDIDEDSSRYLSKTKVSPSFTDENCIVKENDILFARTGASTGKTYLYDKRDGKLYFAGFLIRVNVNKACSSYFIYQQTKINRYKKWVKIMSARSGQPGINAKELKEFNVYFPSKHTQDKITDFLLLIDKRIDTQSKIIEDLQTLKISICDKVFEDTTYPEYKLKDVLSERIEKSNVNNQYEILSSTIKGLFTQKEYFDKDIASSNNIGYKIVHLYDVIISPQNLWMGNITFNQRFTNGLVSPSYKIYIINNNFDMYYIANMLKTKRALYKYICSSQQGASVVRRNLNMDDFLSLSFSIPDINKQRKIGLLLNTIDKRIDLEQTYLTKLNQQKKFLLKNMFI